MKVCFFRLPSSKLGKSMQRLLDGSDDTVMLHYWPSIIYDDAEDFRGDKNISISDRRESGLYHFSTEELKYSSLLRLLGWSGENWDRSEGDARRESASEYMVVNPNDEYLFMSFVENQAEVEKVARDFLKNNRVNLSQHQRRHLKCLQEAMPAAFEYQRQAIAVSPDEPTAPGYHSNRTN